MTGSSDAPRAMLPEGLAARIAAHGLGDGGELLSEPLDQASWAALLACVQKHGVLGFLVEAMRVGSVTTTAEQSDQVAQCHVEWMVHSLVLERLLLDTVTLLTAAEVDYRVIKGPALAHLAYPDPSQRGFGDLDLLVPSVNFQEAVDALVRSGCRRRQPELAPNFDRRFAKSVTLISPGGHEIDLHRTLADGRFGMTINIGDLFASAEPFELGGRTLVALGPAERFVHACYNAAIGDREPRLVSLRDVAQTLPTRGCGWERAIALFDAWQSRALLSMAVALTWSQLALPDSELASEATRYIPSSSERRVVCAYGRGRGSGARALTAVGAIPGVRAKAAFVRALVVPQRRYLRQADGATYRHWWRKGAEAAWKRSRP